MKRSLALFTFAAALVASAPSFAVAPAGAPAGSTGLCKDGSYSSNETKKGACAGHKGVKDWFGADAPADKSAAKPAETAPMKSMPAAATPAKPTSTSTSMSTAAPAAGGGPGQVWVNTSTKVYHCSGTKYYGKTKAGEYMTEAAAKAAGAHADHGKACA